MDFRRIIFFFQLEHDKLPLLKLGLENDAVVFFREHRLTGFRKQFSGAFCRNLRIKFARDAQFSYDSSLSQIETLSLPVKAHLLGTVIIGWQMHFIH